MINRLLNWRIFFFLVALAIVVVTVFYTRYLANKILREERQRVEEWVQANRTMQQSDGQSSIALANMVIINNEDMPLIATDDKGNIVDHRNLDSVQLLRNPGYLQQQLAKLKSEHPPIDWEISDTPKVMYKVYYGNTALLNEVQYYPLVQLLVVSLFIILLVVLLNTHSRSTQNQLWAGMAKETAHQMGTPITSLRGWVEMLKESEVNPEVVQELEKDVERLKLVSDRFSKIGSQPKLETTNLVALLEEMVSYMKRRAPGKVQFEFISPANEILVQASPTLINWVMENLLKNALDAMDGTGSIRVHIQDQPHQVIVDVTDTGKGISAANLARVFAPGFTTKKRGWGLGLTLSKRIVDQYHKGNLQVKQSEPGVGTTFRMQLPKGTQS